MDAGTALGNDTGPDVTRVDGNTCTDTTGDPLNCGSCGHSCLGGACSAGVCQPVAIAAGSGWLAVDANNVYFNTSGGLNVITKSGSLVRNIAGIAVTPGNGFGLGEIVVDDANIYVTSFAFGAPTITKVGKDGTGLVTLASGFGMSFRSPNRIALDDTSVYFTHDGNAISRVGKDGTGLIQLVSSSDWFQISIGVDATNLFVAGENGTYLDGSYSHTWRLNKDGSAPSHLESYACDWPDDVAIDSSFVYVLNHGSGKGLVRIARDGSSTTTLAALQDRTTNGPPDVQMRLRLDDTNAYWTSSGYTPLADGGYVYSGSHIRWLKKDGSGTMVEYTVAGSTDMFNPVAIDDIAIDDTAVYWTAAGSIWKVAK
jgi:hypothetical protein